VNRARYRPAISTGYPRIALLPLGDRLSRAAGELCGATGTADVIDASVVLVAREHHDVIVTGDPSDLRQLGSDGGDRGDLSAHAGGPARRPRRAP
jgi:hypothetical protein